jgi:superfamily II DNA or RNA helicase
MESYLGAKGYTLMKASMSVREQEDVRDNLMARPFMPGSPTKLPAFPVYRESNSKFYIPRYYGIENYGPAQENKLLSNHALRIDVPFTGDMRDYQKDIVKTYMAHLPEGGGLLEIPCGRGKTVMALNIISRLKFKTLVIVHKGFLLNQWVERIEQFLPNARVGRIQGQVVDIEDKDIVIGMLQSLSMKDYPTSLFSSFGLTIVDEVHHIAAEVFVRSLFKIVTPYVLGLSATMQRKDGLTKVFKMFLGDVIYKEKTKQDHDVLVRAIQFKSTDDEFNNIVYDFRGNPQFSTMISKLCAFPDRVDFLLKAIKRTFLERDGQQIIVLAHNKNLLTALYKGIDDDVDNYASVGYYVGGMKEKALKESEGKNVIIATYSMASEALDIKSLTTLVMATPKTDVTQSIGRILRTKHSQPLVIDVVDQHELFQKQWLKRRNYYRKQHYTIEQTDNFGFFKDEWVEIKNTRKAIKKAEDPLLVGKCLI